VKYKSLVEHLDKKNISHYLDKQTYPIDLTAGQSNILLALHMDGQTEVINVANI
jgi:hypothetical protein